MTDNKYAACFLGYSTIAPFVPAGTSKVHMLGHSMGVSSEIWHAQCLTKLIFAAHKSAAAVDVLFNRLPSESWGENRRVPPG